ncbi:MAG: outer membrane lipoprotein carrier protein LolA [Bacteroidota bacterium]
MYFYFRRPTLLVILCASFFLVGFSIQGEGDRILGEAISYVIKLDDFEADFLYEFQAPNRRNHKKSGKILAKDQGARYSILLDEQEVYMDGQTLWVYLPSHNEVMVLPGDGDTENVMESIFKLFMFKESSEYLGKDLVNGHECDKIFVRLKNSPDVNYQKAYVWIGQLPRPRMIEKITFLDEGQRTTSYIFTKIQPNRGLTLERFRFNSNNYPDVTVVDQRDD